MVRISTDGTCTNLSEFFDTTHFSFCLWLEACVSFCNVGSSSHTIGVWAQVFMATPPSTVDKHINHHTGPTPFYSSRRKRRLLSDQKYKIASCQKFIWKHPPKRSSMHSLFGKDFLWWACGRYICCHPLMNSLSLACPKLITTLVI